MINSVRKDNALLSSKFGPKVGIKRHSRTKVALGEDGGDEGFFT